MPYFVKLCCTPAGFFYCVFKKKKYMKNKKGGFFTPLQTEINAAYQKVTVTIVTTVSRGNDLPWDGNK